MYSCPVVVSLLFIFIVYLVCITPTALVVHSVIGDEALCQSEWLIQCIIELTMFTLMFLLQTNILVLLLYETNVIVQIFMCIVFYVVYALCALRFLLEDYYGCVSLEIPGTIALFYLVISAVLHCACAIRRH